MCDEDCPADHKCCVFDCGAVCVPPAFSTSHNVELLLIPLSDRTDMEIKHGQSLPLKHHIFKTFCYCDELISLSPQPSQECVLAGAGVQGCVQNFALMTVTAPVMRNAAIMDVDMSALHHTQVRHEH